MIRPIVLLARPGTNNGIREYLCIRMRDFRSLYFLTEMQDSGLSKRIENTEYSWSCSRRDMLDECRS